MIIYHTASNVDISRGSFYFLDLFFRVENFAQITSNCINIKDKEFSTRSTYRKFFYSEITSWLDGSQF